MLHTDTKVLVWKKRYKVILFLGIEKERGESIC